jgi:hypothetical protein
VAIFQSSITQQKTFLRSCHIFGRNPRADTQLESKDASQIHASVRWNGEAWEIFDHSRNGTTIDGAPLPGEKRAILNVGNVIRFGLSEQATWWVENLTPPGSMLLALRDGEPNIELQKFNFIPDERDPQASVYLSDGGQWVWENGEEVVVLKDGDIIDAGAASWKFICPLSIEATIGIDNAAPRTLLNTRFHFQVSLDEEHVSLKVVMTGKIIDLGERIHHYCLLTLARKRLEDALRGIDPSGQGWIDMERLSVMLGLDSSHLNIQIFRARSQLSRALPDAALLPNLIERRRGEVRFGSFGFDIVRGSAKEGEFNPDQ